MTIYKKQPRNLEETSQATVAESTARQSAGLTSLFKGRSLFHRRAAHGERAPRDRRDRHLAHARGSTAPATATSRPTCPSSTTC